MRNFLEILMMMMSEWQFDLSQQKSHVRHENDWKKERRIATKKYPSILIQYKTFDNIDYYRIR